MFCCYFAQVIGRNLSYKEVERSSGPVPSSPFINTLTAEKLSDFLSAGGKFSHNVPFREAGGLFSDGRLWGSLRTV